MTHTDDGDPIFLQLWGIPISELSEYSIDPLGEGQADSLLSAYLSEFRTGLATTSILQRSDARVPMIIEYQDEGSDLIREYLYGSTMSGSCYYIYSIGLVGMDTLPAGFSELEQRVQVDFSVEHSLGPQPSAVAIEPTIEVPARSIVITIASESGTPIGGTCLMGIPAVFGFVCDNEDEVSAGSKHAMPDLDPAVGVIQIGYWDSGMNIPPTYEVLPPDGYVVINPEGGVFEVTQLGVSEYYFPVVLAPSIPA